MPSVMERLASFPTALPVSLQLSLLRDALEMLSFEVLCPWRFPIITGASQTSAEFRSLLWSSPVFSRAPPCPPEFLLVHRSSSLSAGVPPCLPEFLFVRRSSCYLLGAPFPRSSSEILHEASPVFRELSDVSYDAAIAS